MTRVFFAERTVIRNEPLGPDARVDSRRRPFIAVAPAWSASKDRAEALGGLIDLHSPRGTGTTLRVELPFNRPNGH